MPEPSPEPRGSALLRLLPWVVLAVTLAATGAALYVLMDVGAVGGSLADAAATALDLSFGPTSCLLGALIASNRRGNLIGWLLVAMGPLTSILLLLEAGSRSEHPAAGTLLIVAATLWILWISLLATLILLFPDGRPLSPRWRPVVWFAALWPPALLVLFLIFSRDVIGTESAGPLEFALSALVLMTIVAISASALLRFTRSRGVERQQLKWFAYGTAVGLFLSLVAEVLPVWGEAIANVGLYGPLAGIAIGLFRYRLYDIDVLIGRTVVYGALIAILAGLYTASIRLFNVLFVGVTGFGSEEVLVITTLILATAFTPIKRWLEGIVERRYRRPVEALGATAASAGGSVGAPGAEPESATLKAIEHRLRAIVREELDRSQAAR